MIIQIVENNIFLKIIVTEDKDVRLVHLSPLAFTNEPDLETASKYRLVELHESGFNQNDHHGSKHTGTAPGVLLKYDSHKDYRNTFGRKLEVTQVYEQLYVTTHIQFYDKVAIIKSWNVLVNHSDKVHPIEYLSSFALTGLSKDSALPRDKGSLIHIPHSTWYGEAQWKSYSMNELGYDIVNDFSMKRIHLSSTGTWSSGEHLPMGSYEHTELGITMTWQIETAASWHWEISDIAKQLYIQIAGPTYQESHFFKKLKPAETFESVACAVAIVKGNFEKSIKELTKYRRIIRRTNKDNEQPVVIFNDYMNCLMGDPTTEKLIPLIDAAYESGCEYFCIDCGWYDDGYWWDGVGEWLPSKARFPKGIEEPIRYIRSKGMIPGLWLELEVMGINCRLADKVPEDWFFKRNGVPIIDESRYQLDFRNPEVRAHADSVVKRLVEEYGIGYIKIDYNINPGPGTETDADSLGDGLLQHTRAYLTWIDNIFERYPDLVIENCGSGGMRMEYSLLSRYSIQSVTDQTDYIKMAAIAANCMTAVTPEQAAIWSYPLRNGDVEEVIFNMVNSILFRIHQSGHLAEITPERLAYVQEGLAYHKKINSELKEGLPFWPIGLGSMSDEYLAVGIDCNHKLYLAVWHTGDHDTTLQIPIARLKGKNASVRIGFPEKSSCTFKWDAAKTVLEVHLPIHTARLFEIQC
ncbi:MAG: rafA 4 [Clostridia bacterium]|jgi:alpha-galactosidase|nr:rafA 4 [Clostridia bacterium]